MKEFWEYLENKFLPKLDDIQNAQNLTNSNYIFGNIRLRQVRIKVKPQRRHHNTKKELDQGKLIYKTMCQVA